MRYFYNLTWVKSTLILLTALFSLISVAYVTMKQLAGMSVKTLSKDEVTVYEKRFGALRKELPPHEVMGYISDEGGSMSAKNAEERYLLTQYVLSPVVIEYTTERHLVIGNFSRGVRDDALCKKYHLTIVNDFGDGVVLLKDKNK